jgi:hypothetical protein
MRCTGFFLACREIVNAVVWVAVLPCLGLAEDSTTRALRLAMEENLAAANEEDLPRLLRTMSQEMPNRDLFIAETKKEWAATDTYSRLKSIEVLKHSNAPRAITRLPYATVRVVQTTVQVGDRKSDEPPTEFAKRMALTSDQHPVEYEILWKKEGGKWRMVAGLTEPRPVSQPNDQGQ